MIKLETEFVSGNGGLAANPRIYKQIERTEKSAIYSRTIKETNLPDGFEVFLITTKVKGTKVYQKVYEDDTEEYPSTSKFGHSAWYVVGLERAKEIFETLKNQS